MRRSLMAALAVAAGSLALAGPASGFALRDFQVGLTDPGTAANPTPGAPQLAAGAHPDVTFDLAFPIDEETQDFIRVRDSVRGVVTDLPRGLIVNPTVAPRCTQDLLADASVALCPVATQIGTAVVGLAAGFDQEFPLYNMVRPPGAPAQFGFNVFGVPVKLDGAVRSGGDYGLSATAQNISQAVPLERARVTLWGAPADPVHDGQRVDTSTDQGGTPTPAGIPVRAFTSNPGRCSGAALRFSATATGWVDGVSTGTATAGTQGAADGAPLVMTGCDSLPFEPAVSVRPTTTAPDSPTGLDVSVAIPQSDSPQARASAHLKDLSILLPEGMNVNPSAADGLTACAPGQIALASAASPDCPAASTLGTVTIRTPLLDDPLTGRAYLAAQGDNPFGTTLAMYLAAEGSGVTVKLAGRIDADPSTGRLRVTFADNPELPFDRLEVALDGGPRGPLTTPAACGPQSVQIAATPWSGQPARELTDGFTLDCTPGLGGFEPGFSAGAASPTAGLFSPFSVSLTRPDGQQALRDLSLELPSGLLAQITGVPLCAEAQAAAGSCDPASRVGTTTVTAGAGARPFPLAGATYLTGPYRGAPYGLSTAVRVIAGPLDLGTVVVRQALSIDPEDARVRVASDPLPTILAGIPIRLRTLDVDLDRPGFMVNPTHCATAGAVRGVLGSIIGTQAAVSSRFQVSGCAALPLRPRLALRLTGRARELRRNGHPGVAARLTLPPTQTGLRRVEARLPLSLALDPDNAQELCPAEIGESADPSRCPAGSRIGSATVFTPLLPRRLSGPVYFVQGLRQTASGRTVRTLPKLVAAVAGNGVRLNLRANSLVRGDRLVTQFDRLPDAPVRRFDLRIDGGRRGVLVAVRDTCRSSRFTGLRFRGQSGRLVTKRQRLSLRCPRTR